MSTDATHSFTVGSFEAWVVKDGTFAYPHPAQMFFANASESEREDVLRDHDIDPDQWGEYVSPYSGVVIKARDHTVLIDTGAGDLAPTTGQLRSNLRAVGFEPTDIDTVVLTHAHPDHIGGCVDEEGRPAFPEARYIMTDTEWEFWTSSPDLSGLLIDEEIKGLLREIPRRSLPPLEGHVDMIDDEVVDVVPGVRVHPAPGHTPGHLAVSVTSNGEQLLHLVDTVLHPIHLARPQWHGATDYDPDQVIETRTRLLATAAKEPDLVFVSHFPWPSLGHIRRGGQKWHWEPIDG